MAVAAVLRKRIPKDAICVGLVTRGDFGVGCRGRNKVFERGPLDHTWGFSGGGQQSWIVSGLASDDAERIEVFLGNGERWRAPLRVNATAFRIQRAKFRRESSPTTTPAASST